MYLLQKHRLGIALTFSVLTAPQIEATLTFLSIIHSFLKSLIGLYTTHQKATGLLDWIAPTTILSISVVYRLLSESSLSKIPFFGSHSSYY